jgi:phosphatidylinositol-3-phosphatase
MRRPWLLAWPLPARRRHPGGTATSQPSVRDRGRQNPAAIRPLAAAVAAGCLCLLAACSGSSSPASTTTPASGASTAPAASPAPPAALGTGRVRKILVIMEENHSAGEVFPSGMPYLWRVAQRYGYATNWNAVGHPSLPNYLAIFGGSAFNSPADCSPGSGCDFPAPSVFGQALARGETARAYEESMPVACDTSNSGAYDVNHNPWAYFPTEAGACRAGDVPAGTPAAGALVSSVRAGTLPTVGLLTPNLNHDGHNGTLAQADTWLHGWLPVLMSGPDWRQGRLAIVVVFDEGDTTNQVPFVLIAPGVSGAVIRQPADHYALTRMIDEVIGAQPLRQAVHAVSIAPHL